MNMKVEGKRGIGNESVQKRKNFSEFLLFTELIQFEKLAIG